MTEPSVERPYGWVIVAVATMCLVLGFGANVTVAILIGPFEDEFGFRRADISFAYTMVTIGAASSGLLWGRLSDRIGAQRIAFLGAVCLSGTLAAVSFQSDLWAIHALYLIMGGVGFACLFTPLLALTGLWFDRRKGLALGIVTAGGAVGQGAVPFLARLMISEWGWREAMLSLGIGYAVVLLPALFLLRPPPILMDGQGHGADPNANLWDMPPKISITWLAIAGIFCCICMAVPIVHLVPLGTDLGLSPEIAASLLLTLMMSGMFGRLFFGSLADRVGGLRSYALASLGQTAIVFWFTQTQSLAALYVLSALFGFGFSGVMTCLIICAREAAPLRHAGFAVAIVTATAWLVMGIGGYQGGYFFDLTGAYTTSYGIGAVAGILNLGLLGALMRYRQRRVRFAV